MPIATRNPRRTRLALTLAGIALALTGCGSSPTPADDESTSSVEDIVDPVPTEDTPEAETEDSYASDYLTDVGIDELMVKQLANVAENNGYAASIPMDADGAVGMAAHLVDVCRDIAAGEGTYDGHEADDISMGGTPAQAGAMRRFMEETFCPAVKPEK